MVWRKEKEKSSETFQISCKVTEDKQEFWEMLRELEDLCVFHLSLDAHCSSTSLSSFDNLLSISYFWKCSLFLAGLLSLLMHAVAKDIKYFTCVIANTTVVLLSFSLCSDKIFKKKKSLPWPNLKKKLACVEFAPHGRAAAGARPPQCPDSQKRTSWILLPRPRTAAVHSQDLLP